MKKENDTDLLASYFFRHPWHHVFLTFLVVLGSSSLYDDVVSKVFPILSKPAGSHDYGLVVIISGALVLMQRNLAKKKLAEASKAS